VKILKIFLKVTYTDYKARRTFIRKKNRRIFSIFRCSSLNTLMVLKSRGIIWVGYVARKWTIEMLMGIW
jgi:hypothetical protein